MAINPEMLTELKSINYVPGIIIIYLLNVIGYPIATWIFKSKNTKWGNFWTVWLILSILGLVVLGFFIMTPQWISDLIKNLKEFFL